MRYVLVEWPESQEFIGREGCYYCSPTEDGQLDQAMFVPENIYDYYINGNVNNV